MTTTLVILFHFSLLPSLQKREEEKENESVKIVIKSHAFLLDVKNGSKGIFRLFYIFLFRFGFANEIINYSRINIVCVGSQFFFFKPKI